AAQRFVFIIEGSVKVVAAGKQSNLGVLGYAYLPEGFEHRVVATETSRVAVIEKPYQALDSVRPPRPIVSSEEAVLSHPLEDDPDLQVRCLLPDAMNLVIDRDRLLSEIETLASFSDAEAPAVTRIVFTPIDLKARAWLKERCEDAGLSVRQDAIGNTFARWSGSDPAASVVGTGSHIDAIPNAGRYDGVVGVLGGLEAMRALRQSGFRPKHSIELLVFTSEEPTRFGIGCLGSRLLSGTCSADAASKLTDRDGASLEQVRLAAGFAGELAAVKLATGYYKAFVELHIEQGPILERERIALGVVTHIAAPASFRVSIEGSGGHAGGVLMADRKDALCAAAELILAIENAALTSGAIDTVATVGMCEIFPGAVNSIPSRVHLSVDIRDTDLQRRDAVMQKMETV